MGKETQNPARACPACAELQGDVAKLKHKVQVLAALLGFSGPSLAQRIGRCMCGNLVTREALLEHPHGGASTVQVCDRCDPKDRDIYKDGKTKITVKDLPADSVECARKINAALAA